MSIPPHGDPPGDGGPGTHSADWARVHERFHEALALDTGARTAFLEALAAHHPALAAEVRSLLAAHAKASGFLSESPVVHQRTVAPGDRLGPYRVVGEIGHGGMGVVYRAVRDDESFTKDVAIKLIDPGMRSDEILKRFRAERQILAMLEHPHIARLLDGGTAPDGSPFLVMEYVSGTSLLAYCDAHRLGVEARLALFLLVCDAVQFAHQRLVVHRDLKSDNILVGDDGSPRLLDFGIAKLMAPDGGVPDATVTAPMHRMLTPDYASPEQIRGEPAAVASDVYSLGVILYELLTGTRPLQFKTRAPEEILRVVAQEEPSPPSTVVTRVSGDDVAERRGATTRRLRQRLAGDLDYVMLKALEKDVSRRYGSVDQMAADIRRHLDGRPVLARGASTSYRVSRYVRRHRVAVVATSLVMLALLAGLAGTTWQASVARRERDRATRRFEDVKALAHAVVFDLHDAIANLPGSTRARELLVNHALVYLNGLRKDSNGDPALQLDLGVAYSKIGDVQGRPMFPNLGQSAEALKSYGESLALLREVARARPESLEVIHNIVVVEQRRADLLWVMGRHEDALPQALATRQRVRDALVKWPDHPLLMTDLAVAYGRLRDMRLVSADTAGALEEGRAYRTFAENTFLAHPTDADARRGALVASAKMAELWSMMGQRDSAIVEYRRSEALALAAVDAMPQNTDASRDLSVVYGLHALFIADRDVDAALEVYGRGMQIAEDLAAADPDNVLQQSDVASGHFEIGEILMKGARCREAELRFAEAYRRFSRLATADTGNVDFRLYAARSARRAGEACSTAWRTSPPADRQPWRARGVDWFEKSAALYARLENSGALVGEETAAPRDVGAALAALR